MNSFILQPTPHTPGVKLDAENGKELEQLLGLSFTFIETESTQNEFNIQTVHSRPGRGELITTKTTLPMCLR